MNWLLTHRRDSPQPRSGVAPYPPPTIQVKPLVPAVWVKTRVVDTALQLPERTELQWYGANQCHWSTESPRRQMYFHGPLRQIQSERCNCGRGYLILGSMLNSFESKKKPWYRDNRVIFITVSKTSL